MRATFSLSRSSSSGARSGVSRSKMLRGNFFVWVGELQGYLVLEAPKPLAFAPFRHPFSYCGLRVGCGARQAGCAGSVVELVVWLQCCVGKQRM